MRIYVRVESYKTSVSSVSVSCDLNLNQDSREIIGILMSIY